jgi:N-acetylornithine carbamoyltransferase
MAVPNSFALAAAQMGHKVVIAHPSGYELDHELMKTMREHAVDAGGTVEVTNNVEAAYLDADVIYAKSWGAKQFYGKLESEVEERAQYRRQWIADEQKMALTNNAIFMHCLPVRRNVIVTDGVIDSPASVVIDEAENRLHMQKAILKKLLDADC